MCNGGFGYAAQLFRDLGAEVTSYYDQPNGVNINHFCGSTFPEKIRELTKESGADLGFAFDGDGDRVLAVDEQGNLVNGDHILAIVGLHLLEEDRLPARKVIATAYSNGISGRFSWITVVMWAMLPPGTVLSST